MGLRNTTTEWGMLSKALHWLIAIAIFVLIYYGLLQSDMDRGPERDEVRFLHASLAIGVFALMRSQLQGIKSRVETTAGTGD